MVSALACTTTGDSAQLAHRVDQHRQGRDVVEMRMGQKDVIDALEHRERQIARARAAVDQDVVVDEKGRGARLRTADPAAATEHLEFHHLDHQRTGSARAAA